MKSDFRDVVAHMERAKYSLRGDDETSSKCRDALTIMIDALRAMQASATTATVIPLSKRQRSVD